MDYDEEKLAWEQERQRLASRPWWQKAWDWQRDLAAEHGIMLYMIVGVVFVVMLYTFVHLVLR